MWRPLCFPQPPRHAAPHTASRVTCHHAAIGRGRETAREGSQTIPSLPVSRVQTRGHLPQGRGKTCRIGRRLGHQHCRPRPSGALGAANRPSTWQPGRPRRRERPFSGGLLDWTGHWCWAITQPCSMQRTSLSRAAGGPAPRASPHLPRSPQPPRGFCSNGRKSEPIQSTELPGSLTERSHVPSKVAQRRPRLTMGSMLSPQTQGQFPQSSPVAKTTAGPQKAVRGLGKGGQQMYTSPPTPQSGAELSLGDPPPWVPGPLTSPHWPLKQAHKQMLSLLGSQGKANDSLHYDYITRNDYR